MTERHAAAEVVARVREDHTGYGDCACDECYPPQPEYPLADHGRPLGLFGTLWVVLRGGVRLYG